MNESVSPSYMFGGGVYGFFGRALHLARPRMVTLAWNMANEGDENVEASI